MQHESWDIVINGKLVLCQTKEVSLNVAGIY